MNAVQFEALSLQRTRLDIEGHVATITLTYPQKMNAWGPVMEAEVRQLLTQCGDDTAVRVIVITGEGRAFCAGMDMGTLQAATEEGVQAPIPPVLPSPDDFGQRYSYLLSIPKPIVCALSAAAGVGLVIAMYCDIRWAAQAAKLAPVFARRGLPAEHGLAWILPKIIGLSDAFEWLASARTLSAAEALDLRAVNAVLPDDGFREAVASRARKLAEESSPRAVSIIKRQLYAALSQPLAKAVQVAEAEVAGCLASEDFREGVLHFVEKRPARFTGR
jgi:enoyl-CoA hydratase/carnithine racemase